MVIEDRMLINGIYNIRNSLDYELLSLHYHALPEVIATIALLENIPKDEKLCARLVSSDYRLKEVTRASVEDSIINLSSIALIDQTYVPSGQPLGTFPPEYEIRLGQGPCLRGHRISATGFWFYRKLTEFLQKDDIFKPEEDLIYDLMLRKEDLRKMLFEGGHIE